MSNWKTAAQDELAIVFAEAKAIIASFPAPLGVRGIRYLDKFNPLEANSTNNYICYSLPFWLQDAVFADAESCRRLSLANVFIMLYFFIQDDVMDSAEVHKDWNEQLALSNLFYLSFLNLYRSSFHPCSPFWDYFNTYITDWAVSVATERQVSKEPQNPLRFARKAGPLKLASTGLLLLTAQEALIKPVSEMVDHVLITLQMVDDWADWREDLAEGNENSLLAFLHAELQLAAGEQLTPEQINHALTVETRLDRFAEQALDRHERLLQLGIIQLPHLLAFHQALSQELVQAAQRLQQRKQLQLQGGFVSWLSAQT
ncbi:class 1 isoprenoid biosynthesis enzyme [Paenibacillus solisilvae]|uniref:Class 1 isoprenoid biosynthesis enzyme n=1 Tax=Paenibacillus solisilvae TaxID=2486751 RepID=A0ABW0VTX5_9BACL